jgi:hypothetical protein
MKVKSRDEGVEVVEMVGNGMTVLMRAKPGGEGREAYKGD